MGLYQREVTVVGGVSWSGKTTFTLRYLVNAPLDVRFIFDARGDFSERLGLPAAGDLYELSLALCTGWVIFDPHTLFRGRFDEGFAFFCDWSYEKSLQLPGRKVAVVDEAWKYVTTRRHPVELETCVREGSHAGLDTLFASQTPGQLHETIRAECTELVCFHLEEDKTLDWPVSKGMIADELKSLPNFHYVARNLQTRAELRGSITP
jgi:hypothetical protein